MRLIDADKLKRYIANLQLSEAGECKFVKLSDMYELFCEIVESQPTVPAFGQWIPASDPPEDCEDVIVCISGRHTNVIYDHGVEACDCRYEDGTWYVCGVEADNLTIHTWMPLPEPPEEESRKMIIGGKEVDRIEVFHGTEKVAVISDDEKTVLPGYRIESKAEKTTTVKKCSDMDAAEFEEMASEFCNGYCEFQACENCPIGKYLEQ